MGPQGSPSPSTQPRSDTLQAAEFSATGSKVQAGLWVREVAFHSHGTSWHQDSAGVGGAGIKVRSREQALGFPGGRAGCGVGGRC